MDVAILAGGYGTRLEGLWDKPKCLVPYQGRPVIELIVDKALALKPRKIFLLLGYKASMVVAWRKGCCPHRDVVPIIETVPDGTASALRKALPLMKPPLLILNGDTVPLYDLSDLAQAFDEKTGRTVTAWAKGRSTGASILGAYAMGRIAASKETNLDAFLYDTSVHFLLVPGFIDIGTPETLMQALAGTAK